MKIPNINRYFLSIYVESGVSSLSLNTLGVWSLSVSFWCYNIRLLLMEFIFLTSWSILLENNCNSYVVDNINALGVIQNFNTLS